MKGRGGEGGERGMYGRWGGEEGWWGVNVFFYWLSNVTFIEQLLPYPLRWGWVGCIFESSRLPCYKWGLMEGVVTAAW